MDIQERLRSGKGGAYARWAKVYNLKQMAARKKALYTEYRSAQEEMRQAVAVKANIDHLLGVTDGQRKKEQER